MNTPSFADRYAEAALAPSGVVIQTRQKSTERLAAAPDAVRVVSLAQFYFGQAPINLEWFRDAYAEDDPSFSLVGNQREAAILAAIVLAAWIAAGNAKAILAVTVGSLGGHRQPPEAPWLLDVARDALLARSVEERQMVEIDSEIKVSVVPKLREEITAATDIATLSVAVGKARNEASENAKSVAGLTTSALRSMEHNFNLLREETQILWWLFAGYSNITASAFSKLSPVRAALIAAWELADLTTASRLGPIAASAVLERVILTTSSKPAARTISESIDGLDLQEGFRRLPEFKEFGWLFPISFALTSAAATGPAAWHGMFEKTTRVKASKRLTPLDVSTQFYYEMLLGQLLW